MNMGKQIRENRLRSNLTQDKLAEVLGVTPQAVSKWESGAGFPDITLLPELSSVFGVKIDELFDFSVDDHLNRIENMLEKETMLSRSDFDYAMSYLTKGLENPEIKGRCLNLLANFALQRSQGYADMAADYAKLALEVDPEKKDNHSILCKAQRGAECDWCCANHTELINTTKILLRRTRTILPAISGSPTILSPITALPKRGKWLKKCAPSRKPTTIRFTSAG
ncbi:MAG: helix-turn-helix domain-containing protein [Oscillospiraceae bacterium]